MMQIIIRRNLKVRKLISLSIAVHILLFLSAMDIYFSSPIEKGMPAHKSEMSAVAKRVVVFVSDGLRAEGIFAHQNEHRAPYLLNIRRTSGAWGLCNTQVPTESRPGHVAIFAGMYEDPSAITEGWKNNPIDFDHVFNHSSNSWLWGSPDIVTMFNRDKNKKVHVEHYDQSFEDFSGQQSTIELDEWVFTKVKNFFNFQNDNACNELCADKNIFFLHLLGMDTVGHVHKPDSRQYIENIEFVDTNVKEMVDLIDNFYKDNQTVYIFTSDHGMTDWGSHGGGTTFETEAPFIIWGAGIKKNNVARHIMQGDIAPLISVILGINIPVNSVGDLPDEYLDLTPEQRAHAIFTNARQLGEQYSAKSAKMERTTLAMFYKPFPKLTTLHYKDLLKIIRYHFEAQKFDDAIEDCKQLIELLHEGLHYFQFYYKLPLLLCMSVSLVLWVIYLAISIPNFYEEEPNRDFKQSLPAITTLTIVKLLLIIFSLTLFMWGVLYSNGVEWKYYIFFALPIGIFGLIIHEINQLIYCAMLVWKFGIFKTIFRAVLYLFGIEILVLTFFHRAYISLILFGMIIWIFTQLQIPKHDKYIWAILCFGTAICPLIPHLPASYSFTITLLVISVYGFNMMTNLSNEVLQFKQITSSYRLVYIFAVTVQFGMLILTGIIVLTVGVLFGHKKEIPEYVYTTSWIILFTSLIVMHFSPKLIVSRLNTILNSLVTIYSLMSFSYEGVFLMLFIYLMHEWGLMEFFKAGIILDNFSSVMFSEESITKRPCNADDFRRAFFFLTFILLSYFGAGNIANINSFDPMWIRCFVGVFSPFTMAFLILLKITIPFLITTVFFRIVSQFTCGRLISIFTIVLLYCDIMIMNFMFLVKNEGSWLEIGLSISRFGIVSAMTVVLVIFYVIAYFMTCSPFYDIFYRKFLLKPRRRSRRDAGHQI